MTNEQLNVLLCNIIDRLDAAIAAADRALEGVPRHTEKQYTGTNPLAPMLTRKNKEDYAITETTAIALDPITKIISSLRTQASILSNEA